MTRAAAAVAVLVALLLASCGDDDAPVAHVGDTKITRSQLDKILDRDGSHAVAEPGSYRFTRDINGALGELIHFEWVRSEAKAKGVEASDAEIAKVRDEFASDDPPGDRELEVFALDEKLRGMAHADVSPSEVAAVYARISRLKLPRRDLLAVVTRSRADAVQARRFLEDGNGFEVVAERFAADWRAVIGTKRRGHIDDLSKGPTFAGFDPGAPVRKAAFSHSAITLIGPVHSGRGWYVFEWVAQKEPIAGQSRGDALQAITRELQGERDAELYEKQLRDHWLSKTTCEDRYVIGGGILALGGAMEGTYLSTAGCGNFVPFKTPPPR
jgi:hypothetical protein